MSDRTRRASRTALGPVFAGTILLLLIGIFAALYEDHLYESQRMEAAHGQAEILAASVTAALAFDDRAAAGEYVQSMRVNPAIDAIGVFTQDGRLLAGFARPEASPLPTVFAGKPPTPASAARSVVVPVVQRTTHLGWIYLQASPDPIASSVGRYVVLALLAGMAAVVVAGMGNAQLKLRTQSEHLAQTNIRLQDEINERTKVEEALRQSQKMEALGQLSGGIAHDLNNHLMIIKGNLYLLKRKLGLSSEEKYLVGADEGLNRAAQLTQRVLSFSRKQALSPSRVDMNELVRETETLVRNSLGESIQLRLVLNANSPVIVDKNQMENVILNLAINARDAMPDGGTLSISTVDVHIEIGTQGDAAAGRYVRLSIADTGVGMAPEIREKALDPFFTTKPIGQGTGLGLSTAFGFITQSGGYLGIDSAPGQGTTVSILLPLADGLRTGAEA